MDPLGAGNFRLFPVSVLDRSKPLRYTYNIGSETGWTKRNDPHHDVGSDIEREMNITLTLGGSGPDGAWVWCEDGEMHREELTAVEHPDDDRQGGADYRQYCIDGLIDLVLEWLL